MVSIFHLIYFIYIHQKDFKINPVFSGSAGCCAGDRFIHLSPYFLLRFFLFSSLLSCFRRFFISPAISAAEYPSCVAFEI